MQHVQAGVLHLRPRGARLTCHTRHMPAPPSTFWGRSMTQTAWPAGLACLSTRGAAWGSGLRCSLRSRLVGRATCSLLPPPPAPAAVPLQAHAAAGAAARPRDAGGVQAAGAPQPKRGGQPGGWVGRSACVMCSRRAQALGDIEKAPSRDSAARLCRAASGTPLPLNSHPCTPPTTPQANENITPERPRRGRGGGDYFALPGGGGGGGQYALQQYGGGGGAGRPPPPPGPYPGGQQAPGYIDPAVLAAVGQGVQLVFAAQLEKLHKFNCFFCSCSLRLASHAVLLPLALLTCLPSALLPLCLPF